MSQKSSRKLAEVAVDSAIAAYYDYTDVCGALPGYYDWYRKGDPIDWLESAYPDTLMRVSDLDPMVAEVKTYGDVRAYFMQSCRHARSLLISLPRILCCDEMVFDHDKMEGPRLAMLLRDELYLSAMISRDVREWLYSDGDMAYPRPSPHPETQDPLEDCARGVRMRK